MIFFSKPQTRLILQTGDSKLTLEMEYRKFSASVLYPQQKLLKLHVSKFQ